MDNQTTHQPETISGPRVLTSTVITVVLRVAGQLEIGVLPHAIGYPERQVSVRIGDALVHLTDAEAAGRIRQRWDAGLAGALHLRNLVSQTWLHPRPGTYPVAVSVQFTRQVSVGSRFVPADLTRNQPAHLAVRTDQLLWQVCDQTAWRRIGDAWMTAFEYLQR